MLRLFVCGSGSGEDRFAWQKKLEEDLKGKYETVRAQPPVKVDTKQQNHKSLESFFESSEAENVFRELNKVSGCDLVVANVSSQGFEVAAFAFYSATMGIQVIAFVESQEQATEDLKYLLPTTRKFFTSYTDLLKFLGESATGIQETNMRTMFFDAVQREIGAIFSKEDRKDALFRAAVLSTQVGQVFHYLTHDRTLNPGARPVGSRADEEAQLGDCLVQLLIYLQSRGLHLEDVYRLGTKRMKESVWRRTQPTPGIRELRPGEVAYGISGSRGTANGRVKVVRTQADAERIREGQYVVVIGDYQKDVWDEVILRFDNVLGVISETGSENSHPAIVCRELKKPCIMGVTGITELLKDDQQVEMEVSTRENSIRRVGESGR